MPDKYYPRKEILKQKIEKKEPDFGEKLMAWVGQNAKILKVQGSLIGAMVYVTDENNDLWVFVQPKNEGQFAGWGDD